MCGIFGFISRCKNKKKLKHKEILRLIEILKNRGPDFQSYVEYDFNNFYLCFIHTRLSIVDLGEKSNQPIEDDKLIFIYNGEIYNFRDFGAFQSDTLFLYDLFKKFNTKEEQNIENNVKFIFNQLNGMWALASFFKDSYKLLLIRDFWGKKPLYFYYDSELFCFSSSLQALIYILKIFHIPVYFSEIVLSETLTFRFSHSESIVENIKVVPKGCYMVFDMKGWSFYVKNYFSLFETISSQEPLLNATDSLLMEMVENILLEAIKLRIESSDVPVSFLLSGGIDSSIITLFSRKFCGKLKDSKAYHLNVEKASEKKHAEHLAYYLGIQFKSIDFKPSDFKALFEQTVRAYEYPLVHPNNVGLYKLAKKISEDKYKVVITGEGSDELFGGYQNFNLFLKLNRLGLLKFLRKFNFLKKLVKLENWSNKFYNCLKITEESYLPIIAQLEETFSAYLSFYKNFFPAWEAECLSLLAVQFEYYTMPLLLRLDKIFMDNGIEVRSPFFDINLVKTAFLLPLDWRISKTVLRKLLKKYGLGNVSNRKKIGFPIAFVSDVDIIKNSGKYLKNLIEEI